MGFLNRVRLPLHLSQPQFPVDEEVYLKANGTRRVLKSIVSKEYVGKTDYMPQELHERLAIALRHDVVNIEGSKDIVGIRINGAYEIEWPDFIDHPVAPAKFKALLEGFVARNTRCGICQTITEEPVCRDDYFEAALEEGSTDNEIDVSANDDICCNDAVFSIYSVNSTYVDDVTIDPATGVALVDIKSPLPSTGDVELFQYLVTCPDGSTCIGSVHAGINGSLSEPCEMPTDLELLLTVPFDGTATISWTEPAPVPGSGYGWELVDNTLGITVASGITSDAFVNLTGLVAGHEYTFLVHSICLDRPPVTSPNASLEFTAPSGGGGGGSTVYHCERYLCTNCAEPLDEVLASGAAGLTLFKYYKCGSSPSVVIRPIYVESGIPADTIIGTTFWNTCFLACEG